MAWALAISAGQPLDAAWKAAGRPQRWVPGC